MQTVSRSWVYAAAALLSLAAIGSVVLGATRGGPGRDAVVEAGSLAPVPDAAMAKPLADLTAEDAHFRQIAREEAQAALSRSAPPKPKAVPKPTDSESDGAAAASTPAPNGSDGASTPSHPAPSAAASRPVPSSSTTPGSSAAAAAGQRALLGGASRSATAAPARTSSTTSNPYPPGSSPD